MFFLLLVSRSCHHFACFIVLPSEFHSPQYWMGSLPQKYGEDLFDICLSVFLSIFLPLETNAASRFRSQRMLRHFVSRNDNKLSFSYKIGCGNFVSLKLGSLSLNWMAGIVLNYVNEVSVRNLVGASALMIVLSFFPVFFLVFWLTLCIVYSLLPRANSL